MSNAAGMIIYNLLFITLCPVEISNARKNKNSGRWVLPELINLY